MELQLPPGASDRYVELFGEVVRLFDKVARLRIPKRITQDRLGLVMNEERALQLARITHAGLLASGAVPSEADRIAREVRRRLVTPPPAEKARQDETIFTFTTCALAWIMILQDAATGPDGARTLDVDALGPDLLPQPLGDEQLAFLESHLAWTVVTLDEYRRLLIFIEGEFRSEHRLPPPLAELLALDGIAIVSGPA